MLEVIALFLVFQYPGWSQMEDGSIRVAEVTEDSLGTYACVPYNALGTMGQSPPAPLVLKVLILCTYSCSHTMQAHIVESLHAFCVVI